LAVKSRKKKIFLKTNYGAMALSARLRYDLDNPLMVRRKTPKRNARWISIMKDVLPLKAKRVEKAL
jgi:hypothetical protein